jgi:hypothetical protein
MTVPRGLPAAVTRAAPSPSPSDEAARAARECLAKIDAESLAPAMEGAPELEARRAETFARAKADPVLFVRAPAAAGLSRDGARLRKEILGSSEPVKALYEAYPALQRRRDLAREALLTEGYLYAAWPPFASALSSLIRPEDLFHDPEIVIERGTEIIHAALHVTKAGSSYTYLDGPEAGARVKLLLFDRVAPRGQSFGAPLHRDVGALRADLGFEEARVRHLAEAHVVADLRYGEDWVPTLLAAKGARLSLECEAIPDVRRERVAAARTFALRRERLLGRLREVMRAQVEEALPFDEPKTEVGQQDGKLRQNWVWAYRYGRNEFDFNEDKYKVFDFKGRPRVPQVCIDFVTDTFERAGGSWYRSRGERRERVAGTLDFATLGIDNERSVESFVGFAKAHPEAFEVVELPDEERVPYAKRPEFFAHLAAHRDRYRPGDIVTIYGLRDDGKMHYHSFFVYDADPVTGAPSLVAANAGRPRIRPWEAEMTSAPQRSIRARIRPRLPWLESVLDAKTPAEAAAPTPPPSTI